MVPADFPMLVMFVCIWIIGWTYLTTSYATVYKLDMETSKMIVPIDEFSNLTSYANNWSQWSAWTEWTTCSRLCGGGIRSRILRSFLLLSEKTSENTIPVTEEGTEKKSKKHFRKCRNRVTRGSEICNDKPCPRPKKDFRTVQCERYNKQSFAGMYYTWEAFYDEKDQCVLNCRPLGYQFYATLNSSVIDGTPCKLKSSDRSVCVDGKCQYVGCDGIINGPQHDICGVCGGDNSTCRLVSGLFTKPFLTPGYNYITDIPERACNLNISSMKKTANLFVLRFQNGTYFMNGDSIASGTASATYAAGTMFTYYRGESSGDLLLAPGPISQPLELWLLCRQINTGIKYEYRISVKLLLTQKSEFSSRTESNRPGTDGHKYDNARKFHKTRDSSTTTMDGFVNGIDIQGTINDEELKPHSSSGHDGKKRRIKFKWMVTSYTPCTRTCGEGTKVGVYSCVKENNEGYIVADRKCDSQAIEKPDNPIVKCSLTACPAEWLAGDWGPCSVTCGEGVNRRDLLCFREITDRVKLRVNNDECVASQPPNILRTRPCFRKPCNGNATSIQPYWRTGTWSMCSARCGTGTKTRIVKCMAENEDECPAADRPRAETSCDMGPCSSQGVPQWLTTEWSAQCTEKCGTGIQTRKVACSTGTCGEDSKPETTRKCFSMIQCGARWFAGPWSSCSVECGWGKQSRSLLCVMYDPSTKLYAIIGDQNCTEKQPTNEQACFVKPCEAHWYFSSWSSCSKSCDAGMQARNVLCINENQAPDLNCSDEDEPPTKRSCNILKCPAKTKSAENESLASTNTTNGDPNCTDNISNCNLVLRTSLCNYKYYQQTCCRSCSSSTMKQVPVQ